MLVEYPKNIHKSDVFNKYLKKDFKKKILGFYTGLCIVYTRTKEYMYFNN